MLPELYTYSTYGIHIVNFFKGEIKFKNERLRNKNLKIPPQMETRSRAKLNDKKVTNNIPRHSISLSQDAYLVCDIKKEFRSLITQISVVVIALPEDL